MPIYEYKCKDCRKKFTLLIGVTSVEEKEQCPYCGKNNITRLISSFFTLRPEEEHLEKLIDPSQLEGLDKENPQELRKWANKLSKNLGQELGSDFDEALEEELSEAEENLEE